MVSDWVAFAVPATIMTFLLCHVLRRTDTRQITRCAQGVRLSPGGRLAVAAGLLGFLGLWQLVAIVSAGAGIGRVPTYPATIKALVRLLTGGSLLADFLISFTRIAVGFGISLASGIAFGLLAGTFVICHRLMVPTAAFLHYIPPTAFISVMILYFGIGESHKYAVIFVATVFFNFQMTVNAVLGIDRAYWEMASIDRLSRMRLLRYVAVPGSGPRLWDMFRINLSFAWTFLTAAEIVASEGGLGTLLTRSQRLLNIDDVFAVILFFGIVGVTTDYLLAGLGRAIFPWHTPRTTP